MPSSPTDRAQRLNRLGVTEDDMLALERIWDTETFRLVADTRSAALCDWGYTAIEALDAIWHELDEATAHLYMRHGLTPHQAFLLDTTPQAKPTSGVPQPTPTGFTTYWVAICPGTC